MGLSITDAASLVTRGYKVADLNDVNSFVDKHPDDADNIIGLAKKLPYPDFKSAMQLFFADNPLATGEGEEDQKEVPPTSTPSDNDVGTQDDTKDDHESETDNVDYKELYEKEKTLREQIQKQNQNRDMSGDNNTKESDFDIALKFCNSVLN